MICIIIIFFLSGMGRVGGGMEIKMQHELFCVSISHWMNMKAVMLFEKRK